MRAIDRIAGRRVVLSVSGGKDSAAASLHLRELGIEHTRVFADTGWENPITYEYLRGPLTQALGPIVEVRAAETFVQLVRKKRIFPDRTKRFCTVELKVKPIDEAVAWARTESPAERGRRERGMQVELFADPSDSCGEWGFCESGAS